MNVGDRIKAVRKERNVSADELANRLHVSRSTVFRYESGYIEKFPADSLLPIAQALNTTVEYLMGWSSDNSIVVHASASEQTLLNLFRSLNDDGQRNLMSYIKYLAGLNEFKKSSAESLSSAG